MLFSVFSIFLLLSYLVSPSLSVQVTLEDGQKNKFNKKVIVSSPVLLACAYSPTSSNGNAEIDWIYHKTETGEGEDYIIRNGIVNERRRDHFALVPPSSLQISKTNVDDAGFYECKVLILNDTPNTGKGVYNLTILVPPSQAICQYPSDHALTLGSREELRCSSANGIPPPTYTWYKNNEPLPTDGSADQRYKNTSFTYNPYNGVLVFSKVTSFDEGTYFCRAMNEVNHTLCQKADIVTKEQDVTFLIGIAIGGVCALIVISVVIYCLYKKGYCASCCGELSGKRKERYHEDVPLDDDFDDPRSDRATSEYSGYSAGKLRVEPISDVDGREKSRSLQDQREFSRYSKERLDAPSEYSSHSRSRQPEPRDDYKDRRLQDQQEHGKYNRERLVDNSSEYSGYSRSRQAPSRDDDHRDRRLQDQQEFSKYSRERLVDNSSDYSRRTDRDREDRYQRDRRLADQGEHSRYSRDRLDAPSDYGRERRLEDQREYSRYSRERLTDAPSEHSGYSRRPEPQQRRYSLDRELDASSDYNSRNRRYEPNTDRYSMPVIDSGSDYRDRYAPEGGVRVMP